MWFSSQANYPLLFLGSFLTFPVRESNCQSANSNERAENVLFPRRKLQFCRRAELCEKTYEWFTGALSAGVAKRSESTVTVDRIKNSEKSATPAGQRWDHRHKNGRYQMDGWMTDGGMNGWTFLECKICNEIDQSSFVFSLFLQRGAGPHKKCMWTQLVEQSRNCTKTIRVERFGDLNVGYLVFACTFMLWK